MTILLTLAAFPAGTYALTRFDSTCSLPSTSVNYVSAPNTRGTLDILWSCLFTIIACTWTIQHLNIPQQREDLHESSSGFNRCWYALKGIMQHFRTKLKWMLITVMAPEIILGKAFGDLLEANKVKRQAQEILEKRRQNGKSGEWGLAHSFFAFMGGFRVAVEDNAGESSRRQHLSRDFSTAFALTPTALLYLAEHDHIHDFPGITKDEILDKSKADPFVKTLALLQVLWICLQIIVRVSKGLAVSQLELATAAFCVCAILTYLLTIPKPQSVQVPMRPIQIPRGIYNVLPTNEGSFFFRDMYLGLFGVGPANNSSMLYIPNDLAVDRSSSSLFGVPVAAAVFNGLHLAAWNFTFPTHIEKRLWKIAGIAATASLPMTFVPLIVLALVEVVSSVDFQLEGRSETMLDLWALGCVGVYVVARLFLIVETFRTLGFLPPDAFVATWVSNMPSIS